MVGPDDATKTDNHTNLGGFRNEANAFFEWLNQEGIRTLLPFVVTAIGNTIACIPRGSKSLPAER